MSAPLVLIVDDNEYNRELVEAMLRPEGYRLRLVADGIEALAAIAEELPDLILLDVMMPRMDGYELTEQLRAVEQTSSIPILVLTALRDLEDKVRALELGADDFLSKPINRVELLARARSLLRIRQLHEQLQARNRLLHHVLTHYVDEDLANEILADPDERLKLGGEIRRLSVLFADIRGFTAFSERHPAERVLGLLNRIWSELVPIVFEQRGTFDKYVGDAIMALYGAPLSGGDDALRAARSALEMQRRFRALRREQPELGQMGLGIGIVTGNAVVGNVGSRQVMDYTAIGSVPNLAHRLQEQASSGQILICAESFRAIQPELEAEPLGALLIRGRSVPLEVYTLR